MPVITNYYTGIDLVIDGVEGVDYAIERHYHDEVTHDTKVVFIKPGTLFGFSHNSRNKYGASVANVPPSITPGRIKYKVDRDLQQLSVVQWSTSTVLPTIADEGRISFSTLTYESGVPVLGTTGPKPGITQTYANRANFYWRGIVGPHGEEWHIIAVADDDSQFVSSVRDQASDGKVLYFVTGPSGPVIPSLSMSVTGNAQFITTAPKAYFLPRVVSRDTSILPRTGTVQFTIHDIGGNEVFYRVVSELEDSGSYIAAGSNSVTITDSAFSNGAQFLQYYHAGSPSNVAFRKIVKNPPYPSAGESHGHTTWLQSSFSEIQARLPLSPYKAVWDLLKGHDSFGNIEVWDTHGNQGKRTGSPSVLENAFVAANTSPKWLAVKSSKTWARYAKEKLLQMSTNIDHVGFELDMGDSATPSRHELNHRGYTDYGALLAPALAYDMMIGEFRSNPTVGTAYVDGFTEIEDIHIRERLACGAHNCMMWMAGHCNMAPGMWGYSRNVAGLAVAIVMPNYSSPLWGTSGVNGAAAEFFNTPFPDVKVTWMKMFRNPEDLPVTDYPNIKYNGTMANLCRGSHPEYGDNHWNDKDSYLEWGTCLAPMQIYANLLYQRWTEYKPDINAMLFRLAEGSMRAGKPDTSVTPNKLAWDRTYRKTGILMYNEGFLEIAATGKPWTDTLLSPSPNRTGIVLNDARTFGIVWYDKDVPLTPPAPTAPTFTLSLTDQTVDEGENVVLTVTVGGTTPYFYEWRKNGSTIPNDGATLTLPSVTTVDAGTYTVIVSNVAGSNSSTAVLVVNGVATPPLLLVRSALAPLYAIPI